MHPTDGGEPFSVFETGAILIYLADKTGRFLPKETRARSRVMEWLMWQMSGLGPMLGQHGHFALYAAEKIPYAIERYRDEAARLYRVLDTQLGKTGAYVAGDYSIADIACFPWTMTHKAQGFTLDDYPNVKRWYAEVRARPQVQAGLRSASSSRSRSTRRRGGICSARARRRWRGGSNALAAVIARSAATKQSSRPQRCKQLDCLRYALAMTRMRTTRIEQQKEKPMIEFFFDCSSPWTYLAFHNIQPLAKELGVEITWRPILVGGIFNTVNPSVYASRETPVPLKARYMKKDLADWARSAGLTIKMPPTVFPVNSVKAMRGCIWLGKDMVPFATAVFEAYWGADKDISQDSVLTEVCKKAGVDHVKFFEGIGQQAIKDQLKANTDEVMARGGFGSPTIFVDKTDMYFGNDRMPLIREALVRLKARAA